MKILAMHKVTPDMEAGTPPSQRIVEGMGALVGELIKKGSFLDGEGLHKSALRARVTITRGEPRIEKGPYRGRNELISGAARLRAANLDEAIGHATRIAQALGEGGEVEVGTIVEPWDLGAPAPSPKPPPRFLALVKADAKSEAGTPFAARVEAPLAELKRSNVLINSIALAPSSQGKRVNKRKDRRDIVDGPFAESKELIAGFCLMDLPTWEDVFAFGDRFCEILGGDVEMDLRPLA